MVQMTEENVDTLATEIIEAWDMDTIVEYARENIKVWLNEKPENFQTEWADHFDH